MARIFRRPRQLHPIAELNVTNMVDLGFTLLIIFMITTPLIQSEQTIPVNLPVEAKSEQAKPDPEARYETIVIKADHLAPFDLIAQVMTVALELGYPTVVATSESPR